MDVFKYSVEARMTCVEESSSEGTNGLNLQICTLFAC